MKHFTVCAVACFRFISSCKHTGITLKWQYLYVIFFKERDYEKKRTHFACVPTRPTVCSAKFDRQSNLFTDLGSKGTEHGVDIFIICMNYCLLWPAKLSRIQGCLYYGGVFEDVYDLNDSQVTVEWQAKQPSAIMCCVGSLAIHLPVYSCPPPSLSFKKS